MCQRMKICGLLLWVITTVYGVRTSLNYTKFPDRTMRLKPYRRCNVTVKHGYLHALCNVLVRLRVQQDQTFTMEQHLVSDVPLDENTPDGIVSLLLRSVTLTKWDDFPLETDRVYDYSFKAQNTKIERKFIYPLLAAIRQMTFKATFGEPPYAAAAVCNGTRAERICKIDFYSEGLTPQKGRNKTAVDWPQNKTACRGCTRHNKAQSLFSLPRGGRYLARSKSYYKKFDIRNPGNSANPRYLQFNAPRFFREWNIGSLSLQAVKVTFKNKFQKIPSTFSQFVTIKSLRHILFYKCNFHIIRSQDMPHVHKLKRLEFFHTPIQKIHPHALRRNPGLRHASFTGTKLSGIPEAIFHLYSLETLDISDTDVPRNIKFEFCPLKCQCNSTAHQLVMSRSRLGTLSDRAFCGFPRLTVLELESCHISQLSGSPFECLENLSNLSLSDNKIRSLGGENLKGLRSLHFLNLNRNQIVRFECPRIFSTLTSLRALILSENRIGNLLLEAVDYAPVEEINLGRNQISKWNTPLFSSMSKLKTLHLEHNAISRISDDMLRDMSKVSFVNLSYNLWDCSSCQHKNLLSLLQQHPVYCSNCYVCKNDDVYEGRLVLDVPWNKTGCTPPNPCVVYGAPSLLSILVASVVAYVVYRNRWFCMYGLLYLKVAVKRFRRQKQAGRFLWDGFLSYHASDAEWVRDVLVPKLESAPMNFRLCVADRDFIPGLPIAENICRAIAQSRVSLFVLSREFCRSRWCMFELGLAQHRLFENDRNDGMVFIRKIDLQESEMSPMLTYLMKTRTYIQLPPDDSSETLNNFFWLQVQAALQQ